jgi:hypothetical protein
MHKITSDPVEIINGAANIIKCPTTVPGAVYFADCVKNGPYIHVWGVSTRIMGTSVCPSADFMP